MEKKSILIVTQYFYPEQFRINDLALELKDKGYDVSVLTGLPNYPKGEYFEGYDANVNCDEIWNDIKIYRCNLRPRKKGSINLIRNYISFIIEANKKYKTIKENKYDLIYVFEVSPITVALPAIKIKKNKNIPLIMNVQDLWPENIVAVTGIDNPIIVKPIKMMVKYIYINCDLILGASKSFVPNIQNYLKKDKGKVIYWPQYSVVSRENKEKDLYDKEAFNIVFTGNIGNAQGLDLVIEAAKSLTDTPIRWHLVGDGREQKVLETAVKENNLSDYIFFYGRKPENEIPQYLANADAALLILKPDPVFEMTVPAKLQTYLACGVPIIGCVNGEGKRIIDESKAGVVSDDVSVEGLINACNSLIEKSKDELQEIRNNSLKYGINNFDKNKLIEELVEKMEDLL